jgi:hypothetical protein
MFDLIDDFNFENQKLYRILYFIFNLFFFPIIDISTTSIVNNREVATRIYIISFRQNNMFLCFLALLPDCIETFCVIPSLQKRSAFQTAFLNLYTSKVFIEVSILCIICIF